MSFAPPLPSRQDLLDARARIAPHIERTALTHSYLLGKAVNGDVWLNEENLQRTGSFKVRGALNRIASLTTDERRRGVVAASAGNHALGVGYACRELDVVNVDLFVQATASPVKLSRLSEYAANVETKWDVFEFFALAAEPAVKLKYAPQSHSC